MLSRLAVLFRLDEHRRYLLIAENIVYPITAHHYILCLAIVNEDNSGVGIIIPFFPPNFSSLTSASPIVRDTLSRPGKTRNGPFLRISPF